MSVDLQVVFEATVTAEEAFALPERLNSAPAVVAAGRAYYEQMKPCYRGLELRPWGWEGSWPTITTPSDVVESWASHSWGSVLLAGTPGLLWLGPTQIELAPGARLEGFALNHDDCQAPIRHACHAIARALGTIEVLYLPDSGRWPPEVGEAGMTFIDGQRQLDDAVKRVVAATPSDP